MRQCVGCAGRVPIQYRRHRELVLGIDDRPQEAHGDCLHTPFGERGCNGARLCRIERRVDLAFRRHPFADLKGEAARHVRRWVVGAKIVRVALSTFAEHKSIGKSFGGEKRCLRRLAFDDGVGGMGGAVDEDLRTSEQRRQVVPQGVCGHLQRRTHTDENPLRRGQGLLHGANARLVRHHDIRKGAPCVDRNAVGTHGIARRS